MSYQDTYQQYLNYYNNPEQNAAPDVSIVAQGAPSQGDVMVSQGAGLAGKGAGIYAGGKLGGALFGGSKVVTPQLVGAKVVGSNAPIALTANPALPASYTGVGTKGSAGLLGGAGATAGLGAMAALMGAGAYNYGGRKVLDGDASGRDYLDLALQTNPMTAWVNPVTDALGIGSIGSLFGSGKSEEQKAREGVRGKLSELGLLRDDNGQGYLAEFAGQDPYLMGFSGDFNNQDTSIKDLAKVLQRDAGGMNENRNSWDVDYTSDLDFMTNLASEGLGGLLFGGNMKDPQKHIFRELTNASLADTNRDFNEDNWQNTMGDIRSLYEKAGFSDADVANQRIEELIQQGVEQDKINQLKQGIGLVFGDNSYNLAQDLNAGRWAGVEQDYVTRPLSSADLAGALL